MSDRPIIFSGPSVRAILEGRKPQTRRVLKPQPPTGEWDVGRLRAEEIFPTVVDRYGEEQPGTECFGATSDCGEWCLSCPYGGPGDHLWVRETWRIPGDSSRARESGSTCTGPEDIEFAADFTGFDYDIRRPWRPSIFMPRWASRLTLRIVGVRVERLQEISEADSLAEGCRAVEAEPWWQGYKECEGELMHQQARGRVPPDWMIEPKPSYNPTFDPLACTAKQAYEILWNSINGKDSWDANPWVWVIEFERVDQQRRAA